MSREPDTDSRLATKVRTWNRRRGRARPGSGSVRRDERVRRFRATCPRPSTRRQRIAAAYGCATQTRPSASPAAVRTGAQWLLVHDQALSGHRTVRGTRRGPGQKRRPCLRPASSGRTQNLVCRHGWSRHKHRVRADQTNRANSVYLVQSQSSGAQSHRKVSRHVGCVFACLSLEQLRNVAHRNRLIIPHAGAGLCDGLGGREGDHVDKLTWPPAAQA